MWRGLEIQPRQDSRKHSPRGSDRRLRCNALSAIEFEAQVPCPYHREPFKARVMWRRAILDANHVGSERGLLLTSHEAPLRGLVHAVGSRRRQRSLVVPLSPDEPRKGWVPDAGGCPSAGLGNLVPARWSTGDLYPAVS